MYLVFFDHQECAEIKLFWYAFQPITVSFPKEIVDFAFSCFMFVLKRKSFWSAYSNTLLWFNFLQKTTVHDVLYMLFHMLVPKVDLYHQRLKLSFHEYFGSFLCLNIFVFVFRICKFCNHRWWLNVCNSDYVVSFVLFGDQCKIQKWHFVHL